MNLPFKMRQETEIEKWRAATFWEKEPETIAWIQSFDPGGVFFDVGANVGIYSLYAASLCPEMRIVAFEPMFNNHAALFYNIHLNELSTTIFPRQYAVGLISILVSMEGVKGEAGESGAQAVRNALNGENLVIMVSIDDFCMGQPKPTYIKIDIDGQELNVIKGAEGTLPYVKSILIEASAASKPEIVAILTAAGFTINNRFNKMSPHSRERRAKEGIDAENIIFTR